jgi:hypothetical protein
MPEHVGIIDWQKWRNRRGRFAGLEKDSDERPQEIPEPEPAEAEETHSPGFERKQFDFDRAGGDDDS